MTLKIDSVDGYIASFPEEVQVVLSSVREAIHRAAPGAEESISYQMPKMTLDGKYLVYFGGWKHHVGIYPVPITNEILEARMAPYRSAKSTLKFPLKDPIPYDLIEDIVSNLVALRG